MTLVSTYTCSITLCLVLISIGRAFPFRDALPVFHDLPPSNLITPRDDDTVSSKFAEVLKAAQGPAVTITGGAAANNREGDQASAVRQFEIALQEEGETYDGDFKEAATKLVYPKGQHGCDVSQQKDIYRGWAQSWKIMNRVMEEIELDGINWNEASAVEYLGPPALNKDVRAKIIDLYNRWGTIQPAYIPTWFDWQIHARCDDPRRKCGDPCDEDLRKRGPFAYTTNADDDSGKARINFCPLYFRTPNLKDAIENGNVPDLGPRWQFDVGSYLMNKGHVWAHELMHIDWATNAEENSPKGLEKRHVTDIRFSTEDAKGAIKIYKAYGPQAAKSLARYPIDSGEWTIRNADSLALYAFVRYLQSQLKGVYPHLPLAPAPPDSVWDPDNRDSDSLSLPPESADQQGWDLYSSNGTVGLPPVHNYYSHAQLDASECPASYPSDQLGMTVGDYFWDEDGDETGDPELVLNKFATTDDLGEDYVKQLDQWWSELYDKGECEIPSGCYNAAAPDGCAVACT